MPAFTEKILSDFRQAHVLHVVRQGYRKGDRVLRPAQVIVAQRPS